VPSSRVCAPLVAMPRGQEARHDSLDGILMRYSSCMVPGPRPTKLLSAPEGESKGRKAKEEQEAKSVPFPTLPGCPLM